MEFSNFDRVNALMCFFRIKDKINNPPERQDYQKISHSLARFIKLKDEAKKQPEKKKKFKRNVTQIEDKPGKYTFHFFEIYL